MTPLLRVTLAFIAGLVPGLLLPPRALPIALAVVFAWRRPALAFGILGCAAGIVAAERTRTACPATWRHDQRITLTGYVSALPQPGRAVGFEMTHPCRGSIRTTLPRNRSLAPGVPARITGQWQAFDITTRWPTPPARRGVLFAGTATQLDSGAHAGPMVRARIAVQRAFRARLPNQHGMAEALVLAQRDALDPAVRDAFVKAGLAHLLAISGTHVLIFAGMLLLVLRIARAPLTTARMAAVILIGAYVLALGMPPPAARAALQFGLVMLALLLQRPAHAWTLLAGAALALLVIEPMNALDVGFQLSFAGVAGLLAYRRRLKEALPLPPATLRDGIATGLAATIATAPIAALHFGQFAPIGLLATLIAGPLVALALPALILVLIVPPLAPGVELILRALHAVAAAAAQIPGGHFAVDAQTLQHVLLASTLLLLWRAHERRPEPPTQTPETLRRKRRLKRLHDARDVAAACALVLWLPLLHRPAPYLELHAIDVGQGDALALRTPRDHWIVIDAGMRTDRSDMGARRVVPYLLERGVRRIDALVLTHAHADHIGGALALFAAFDVRAVIDPGLPGRSAQYLETLHAATLEPARWIAPRPRTELTLDGITLTFLYPSERLLDAPADPNDFSLVFRLGFGRFTGLFLGDAPRAVEDQLVAEYGTGLTAAVLKVGHHGSRTSTGDSLLAAASPELALVSVGRDNRYGHPADEVMARLLRHGVRVLRTDERGSVRVRAWRSGRMELVTQR